MKEFYLDEPYASIQDMLKGEEVAEFTEELKQGEIDQYAFVSRIGNRYDLDGKKIAGFSANPFFVGENKEEEQPMKYAEIEALIDEEIAKAVDKVKAECDEKVAELIAKAKADAKAELIAKLTE